MKRKLGLPLAALAGICALALVPGLAAAKAHHHHFATAITLNVHASAGKLNGKVKSDKAACVKRDVILNQDGHDVFDLNSKADGTYGIQHGNPPSPLDPGDYFVHVKPKTLGNGDTCKGAKSKTVTVPA